MSAPHTHATGSGYVAGCAGCQKKLRAVIEALAEHPECDVHPDDDPVTCGWKAAVIDVRNAIQAALAVNNEGGTDA